MNRGLDAQRMDKLRQLAVRKGALEAFVAMNQLDFFNSDEQFNVALDRGLASEKVLDIAPDDEYYEQHDSAAPK